MTSGIVSYGIYIPRFRIKVDDIADTWGKKGKEINRSLGVVEKSVPNMDEDTVTIAIEAAQNALLRVNINSQDLEVCFVGSESHPYAVNPTATIVGELIGMNNNYLAADLEFACKAATAGIQATAGLIEAKKIKYGLVIGADTAQSRPHDVLEYTAAAAAAAYILGSKPQEIIANIFDFTSYSSDTPDFWRREGIRYPSHGGRFTGEPAYFSHVLGAANKLLNKTGFKPDDFSYCVFHMPNGRFPREAAKRLGFTDQQLKPSLIVDDIGNPYSASSLLGLAAVLDRSKPKEKIFLVSYGSGAGADSFVLETTDNITKNKNKAPLYSDFLENKNYISYTKYLRLEKKI